MVVVVVVVCLVVVVEGDGGWVTEEELRQCWWHVCVGCLCLQWWVVVAVGEGEGV